MWVLLKKGNKLANVVSNTAKKKETQPYAHLFIVFLNEYAISYTQTEKQ